MKTRSLLSLLALFVIASPQVAVGQEAVPAPPAPPAAVVAAPQVAAPPAVAVLAAPQAAQAPAPPAVAAFFDGDNFLGVHVEEVTRENMSTYGLTGEPRGVAVTRVVKDSPAERAGVRERDVIVRFDGEQVSSVRKLNRLIDESSPEHSARLAIRRGGSEQEVTVKLGRRENFMRAFEGFQGFEPMVFDGEMLRRRGEEARQQAEEVRKRAEELRRANPGGVYSFSLGASRRVGISTSTLGKQLAEYFGVSHGMLVSSVEENSPASKAGLKAGDIITEAEGEKLEDAGDLGRVINRKEEGEVTLTIVRDRQRRTVKVTPERRGPQTFDINPNVWVTPPRIARAVAAPRVATGASAPRVVAAPPARAVSAPHFNLVRPHTTMRMRPERAL